MFEEINKELRECKENIILRDTLNKKLLSIEEKYIEKEKEREKIKEKLDKEFRDIENLKKLSMVNMIATLLRNKEEKLYKEEQEYLQVKFRYDETIVIIDGMKNDIEVLKRRLKEIEDYEDRYDELIKEKSLLLKSMDKSKSEILQSLENRIEIEMTNKIEIEEAIEAAAQGSFSANNARKDLESAKSWGDYDIFLGGMFSSVIKHDGVKAAQKSLEDLGYCLNRLNKELVDINMNIAMSIIDDINSKYVFDVFFDNIFTDIAVQDKIKSALSKVYQIQDEISNLQYNLEEKKKDSINEIIRLRNNYAEVVISS